MKRGYQGYTTRLNGSFSPARAATFLCKVVPQAIDTAKMLVKQSYKDVPTTANGVKGTIRIYVIEPNVPEYPEAKFPGCTLPFADQSSRQNS